MPIVINLHSQKCALPGSYHRNNTDHVLVKKCRYESFCTSRINRLHEHEFSKEKAHLRAIWSIPSWSIHYQPCCSGQPWRFPELQLDTGLDNQHRYFLVFVQLVVFLFFFLGKTIHSSQIARQWNTKKGEPVFSSLALKKNKFSSIWMLKSFVGSQDFQFCLEIHLSCLPQDRVPFK